MVYNTPTECLSGYQSYDKITTDALSIFAGVAELADAPDLGSGGFPCRFDPCHPHHTVAHESKRIYGLFVYLCINVILKAHH